MTSEVSAESRWQSALLSSHAIVQDAIRNLDESGLQIALVVEQERRLLGTITDGDIRRGLLRGLDLSSPIDTIVYRDPMVVPPHFGRETVLQLMQANKVRQMPVVDESGRVVGLHLWDQLMVPMLRSNAIVIMAGGRGTRLRPHTDDYPKPMLPVHGKPMLEHIIERAKAEGFHRFTLAVHYLGHIIEDHFGDGSRWGVCIDYVHEDAPLGTAGALGLLDPRPDQPFLITNGDVLTDVRYAEVLDFHVRHGAAGTMAVRLYEWQHPYGVVHIQGVDITGFDEKPVSRSHINAGIYVLDPTALDAVNGGEACDMPTLFARLHGRQARTIVYPMHEPWLDVGRAEDYSSAQKRSG